MKKNFTLSLSLCLFFFALLTAKKSFSQCADGSSSTPLVYDTTIRFGAGVTSTLVKFPQFDPQNGMVRCVKLIVTMTGVVDTVRIQNTSSTTQTASFSYNRNDQMSGPGLITPLSASASKNYGPYTLTADDGIDATGTDYVAIPRDTVMNSVTERVLTDSTDISQFYGHDSVTYTYDINVSTNASITGGNSDNKVRTSAFVNFRFEYCVCPKVILPIGLKNFTVTKTTDRAVNLSWEGENDDYNYVYDIEMSRDGKHFSKIAIIDRKYTANPTYLYPFSMSNNEYGQYYFRVRQNWQVGYVRYTQVKSVEFTNPVFATTSLYPNPSTGGVGIKFVNVKAGSVLVQVSNAHGQRVLSKELTVDETDFKAIGSLPAGIYWVKLIDLSSHATCVKELLIQ